MGAFVVLIGVVGGIVVGLVVLVTVLSARQQRERRDRLCQWAAGHGWQVAVAPANDWWARMPGRNRRGVSLALSGTVGGRPVSVADYSHTEVHISSNVGADGAAHSHTTTRTHHFVALVVWLERPGPTIAVQHRGGLSKLGRAVFGDRTTALGDERFDRKFRISADDPGVVHQVVGPGLAAEHLAGRVPAWSLQGAELLAYYPGQISDPDRIPGLITPLVRVAELLGR